MAGTTVADHDGIWVVSLARPPVNAIDVSLVAALRETFSRAARDGACRAVVLTGSPPAFSAGVDVKAFAAYGDGGRTELGRSIDGMVLELYGMPKPTVAAINGHALGGGLVLALACDFRLAAQGSYRLGLTEATAGIPFPAAPLLVVRAELDHGPARRLTLGAATFGPTDPLASAFIDELHAPEQLVGAAIERAARAATAPAYAAVKLQMKADALRAMRRILETPS